MQVKFGIAPSQWFLESGSITSELKKTMDKNGFVRIGSWPGMAIELEKANMNFPVPNGLRVEDISDKNGLYQFEKVVSAAMFGGGLLGMDLIAGLHGDDNIHLYLAFLDINRSLHRYCLLLRVLQDYI